jgi:hypothetical protein
MTDEVNTQEAKEVPHKKPYKKSPGDMITSVQRLPPGEKAAPKAVKKLDGIETIGGGVRRDH